MAVQTDSFDPAAANQAALDLLERERKGSAEGIDPDAYRAAVQYSIGRYTRGLPHYVEMSRKIGLSGYRSLIDVGSGAGHWTIALALDNEEVHGVELRGEYVEIAKRVAALLGVEDRVTFAVGRGEDSSYPDDSFEAACCHSVLMFTDHEAVLRNIGRWIPEGAPLYVGYTTFGSRLDAVMDGLSTDNPAKVASNAKSLLAQELYRCGLGRTPGTRVRTFLPEEIVELAAAIGFEEESRPGAQDGLSEFAGYPGTIDFVFRKVAREPRKTEVAALEGDAWIQGLHSLVRTSLPETVMELIEEDGADLEDRRVAEVYVRALVKAQRSGERLQSGAENLGEDQKLARGLARHAEWAFEDAQREYASAPEDDLDSHFLQAACLLELKRYDEADELLAADAPGLRRWTAQLAVAVARADLAEARRLTIELLEERERDGFGEDARAGIARLSTSR